MIPVSYFVPIHKKSGIGGQNPSAKRKRDDVEKDIDEDFVSARPQRGEEQPSEGESALLGASYSAVSRERSDIHISTNSQVSEASSKTHKRPEDHSISSKQSVPKQRTIGSLGHLKPPFLGREQYLPPGLRGGQALKGSRTRQRHLAVLTAILHRSLLQYDYARAGRVWGMLLRSEVHGQSVDLRSGHRWGLGAEILIRQQNGLSSTSSQASSAAEAGLSTAEGSELYIKGDDFEKVRQYYERLSIQYPYYRSYPDATGPLDFRFAMYSLWIYAFTGRESHITGILQVTSACARSDLLTSGGSNDSRQKVLREAGKISQSLGELITSPPYSDCGKFRNLKDMVDRWTADLTTAGLQDGTSTSTSPSITDGKVSD